MHYYNYHPTFLLLVTLSKSRNLSHHGPKVRTAVKLTDYYRTNVRNSVVFFPPHPIHSVVPQMIASLLHFYLKLLSSGGSVPGLQFRKPGPAWKQHYRGLSAGPPTAPHLPPSAGPQGSGQPLHVWSLPLQGGTETAGI